MKAHQILLMEDDQALAAALESRLRASGFVVHSTPRMDEALLLFEKHAIAAAITDFHVQHGNGRRLLHQLRKVDPGLPVFLITGTPFVTEAAFENYGFTQVFLKPFQASSLIEALQKALGEKHAAP